MDLKIIQDDEHELWDSAVLQCPGATIFHTWKWLKIAEKYSCKRVLGYTFPAELSALMVSESESFIGLFPVFLYKLPFFRMVTSPPVAVENLYLGPLLYDMRNLPRAKQERQIMNFCDVTDVFIKKTLRPNMILIHTSPAGMDDMRPYKWAGYDVEPRYTYEVDLTVGKTNIWNEFPKALRNSTTKAKRIGISVEEGTLDDLGYIYDRLKERNHIHPEKQFFAEIFNNFSPVHLKVFIARRGGQPISGIVALIYGEKVMFWIGAPKCLLEGISPNELVMWECISWASDNGYRTFELMGADDITLMRFKGKFNGKPKMYFTIRRLTLATKLSECIYRLIKPRYSS